MLFRFIVCSFLICFALNTTGQQFGGNHPSVKWRQINSDTARIIFQHGMESKSKDIANLIHDLAKENRVSLGSDLKKINIVLQNRTTIANGYVGLGPYRSEFFLTPFLNNFELGSLPWYKTLAIHEYRHVQQYNNFRNGGSKIMYYLFGEEGLALATNASVPDWFFEGDAIYYETILTNQGRGRLPAFNNEFPALWNEGKNYSWMKLRNGSLKHFVPDHYSLGYILVNYGRQKYGDDIWEKVTQDASAFKGLLYPFQRAIKKHTGIKYSDFYKQALDNNKKFLVSSTKVEEEILDSPRPKQFSEYLFPFQISEDSLLYLKRTFKDIPAFYIKDKNGEHRLRAKDISLDNHYSYKNGRIVYAAYEPDSRFGYVDYGIIKILDIKTGEQKTLLSKSKYFTPDISEDGSKALALQIGADGKNELHVIDISSGEIIHSISSKEDMLYTDPKFLDDENIISAIRLSNGQMALGKIKIETGEVELLTPPSFAVLGYPNVVQDKVYFSASYSGNDELYVYDLKVKKIFKLTESSLGNYFVSAFGNKISWSAFTADGYRIKSKVLQDIQFIEVNLLAIQETVNRFPVNNKGFSADVLNKKIPARDFEINKYKKGYKPFNFHSWRPDYEDPEFTFTIYGQNILNTLQTDVYYTYNQNEKTNAGGINLDYAGIFPHITAGVEYIFDRKVTVNNVYKQWNEFDVRIGIRIPLNLTRGRTYNFFSAGTNLFNRQYFYKTPNKDLNYNYLHHFISWSQQVQRARQQFLPRLAYSVSYNHRYAITEFSGYQALLKGSLYLPGIMKNHNLVINSAFQQRDTTRQLFGNRFANSRGYNEYYFSRMWMVSGNYHFPILFPDWGFGNLVYFQRVRANAFYDFTKNFSRDKKTTRDLRSVGGEIFVDTKWWNQHPLTFGFRISHLLNDELSGPTVRNRFEFIVPINLIPD